MNGHDRVLLAFCLAPSVGAVGLWVSWRLYRASAAGLGRTMALVAGNLCLLLSLVGGLLLGGEVYYRFWFDETEGWDLGLVAERWHQRHRRTNNVGIRDNVDYAPQPDPGRSRLTVVGDSFAVGHGLRDVEQRFTNLLRRENPDWDVQLLADDGMDTGAIAKLLLRFSRSGYETDYVLYAYCPNDISDLITDWKQAALAVYDVRPGYLVRNSYFLNTYFYRIMVALDPATSRYLDVILDAYRGPLWDEQTRRLAAMRELVERNDARLVVVTFPFLETLDVEGYAEVHERLGRFWESAGVPYLDLLPVFREFPASELRVNRHDTHPNAFANRLAFERIQVFLESVDPRFAH